jgi:WD40 repeat protein
MLSVATTIHYTEKDSQPLFADWLTNDTIVVFQSDGNYFHQKLGQKSKIIRQKSGFSVIAMQKALQGKKFFVLTKQNLEIYEPNSIIHFTQYSLDGVSLEFPTLLEYKIDDLIVVNANSEIYSHNHQNGWLLLGQLNIKKVNCGCKINSSLYVFGSAYGELEVISINPFESYFNQRFHADSIQDIVCIEDSCFITASRDRSISCWKFNKQITEKWSIPNFHKHFINCLALVNEQLWIGSSDGTIKILRLSNNELIETINIHKDAIRKISFSPDQTRVLTISDDGTYKIVLLDSLDVENSYGKPRNYILSADSLFKKDISQTIIGTSNGDLLLLISNQEEPLIIKQYKLGIRTVKFINENEYICGIVDGTIHKGNLSGENISHSGDYPIYSIGIIQENNTALCGRRNGIIEVFNIDNLSFFKNEKIHQSIIGDIFITEGEHILTCSDDQTINILRKSSLLIIKTISIKSSAINNLEVVDNKILATTDDNKVFLIDKNHYSELEVYDKHKASVRSICKLKNDLIVSGDREGNLNIWRLDTLETVWSYKFETRIINLKYNIYNNNLLIVSENEVIGLHLDIENTEKYISKNTQVDKSKHSSEINYQNLSSSNTVKELSLAQRLKKESLEKRLAGCEKDYQSLDRDYQEAGDSDEKNRLQLKLDRKLEEIENTEKELKEIND